MWQRCKNVYHLFQAVLANWCFGFPSKGMRVIGVTGTDGKTTTAALIYHILKHQGKPVALISTVGAFIGDKEYSTGFHVTTPNSFALQSYLKKAKAEGIRIVIIEVTSHALDQNRVFGIHFTLGIITNITHEHLDYHKTYEDYVTAKIRLLAVSHRGIVNSDDASYPIIKKHNLSKLISFGRKDADITFDDISGWKTNLIGEYNKYNILAATVACEEVGLTLQEIRRAVSSFHPPKGRGEVVYDRDFVVMIDFAHTPNALLQLLSSLKKMRKSGRIIHVFGSAGERDITKRPMMGEAASRFDDLIVLTAEDPRGESVEKIMEEIEKGIIRVGSIPNVEKIEDRQKAIQYAVSQAEKNDLVLITGKGHEESMNLGNGEESWSDHEAVERALSYREK